MSEVGDNRTPLVKALWTLGTFVALSICLFGGSIKATQCHEQRTQKEANQRQQALALVSKLLHAKKPPCLVKPLRLVKVSKGIYIARACNEFVTVLCDTKTCGQVPNNYRPNLVRTGP